MEHILPYLFSMFVGTGIDTVKQILVRRINSFFMRHFEDCKALNNTNVSPRGSYFIIFTNLEKIKKIFFINLSMCILSACAQLL